MSSADSASTIAVSSRLVLIEFWIVSRIPVTTIASSSSCAAGAAASRSEEHTSELQSLMRISYAVFCLKKKKKTEKSKNYETINHTDNTNMHTRNRLLTNAEITI